MHLSNIINICRFLLKGSIKQLSNQFSVHSMLFMVVLVKCYLLTILLLTFIYNLQINKIITSLGRTDRQKKLKVNMIQTITTEATKIITSHTFILVFSSSWQLCQHIIFCLFLKTYRMWIWKLILGEMMRICVIIFVVVFFYTLQCAFIIKANFVLYLKCDNLQNKVTCLLEDCCFNELALSRSH
jgi:hypothetical protein